MSKKAEIISIRPPEGISWESYRIETLKSNVHICPVCFGTKGKYYDEHDLQGERWVDCRTCKGTGSIQADIVITWHPVELTKEDIASENTKRLLSEMLDCFTVDTSNYSFHDFVQLTHKKDTITEEIRKVLEE